MVLFDAPCPNGIQATGGSTGGSDNREFCEDDNGRDDKGDDEDDGAYKDNEEEDDIGNGPHPQPFFYTLTSTAAGTIRPSLLSILLIIMLQQHPIKVGVVQMMMLQRHW